MSDIEIDPALLEHIRRADIQGQLKVKAMLREWDPIGVCPNDYQVGEMTFDEYDSYATRLFQMLHRESSTSEIVSWLRQLASDHMGMPHVDEDKTMHLVQELQNWWKRWKINERMK